MEFDAVRGAVGRARGHAHADRRRRRGDRRRGRFAQPGLVGIALAHGLAIALIVSALLVAAGCSGDGDEPDEWAGPGAALGKLDPERFNDYADGVDEPWRRSPALVAGEYVRVDVAEARVTTIAATTGPEGGPSATATVTLDGLLDDSVRARRYVLGLARDGEGTWRVDSALATQRCWPGRGHQGYAPTLCR